MEMQRITVKMILDRWNASIKNMDDLLLTLSDEQLGKEIAPSKNSGTYLFGHLIAVHDALLPLLDMGTLEYPELFKPFIELPYNANTQYTDLKILREMWKDQSAAFAKKVNSLSEAEWFSRHTSVSAADFEKEPHRNKLNVILTRTTHLQYHLGQLVFLKK